MKKKTIMEGIVEAMFTPHKINSEYPDTKELRQGNRLIALFLNYAYFTPQKPYVRTFTCFSPGKEPQEITETLIGWVDLGEPFVHKGRMFINRPKLICRRTDHLKFQNSWDDMMTVIKKIEQYYPEYHFIIDSDFTILANKTIQRKFSGHSKEIFTWRACVHFLNELDSVKNTYKNVAKDII